MEKGTPGSYWIQCLYVCEVLGRPGIKVKESEATIENIPSTMVLHKNVDGVDTIFVTMSVLLMINHIVKWFVLIIIGSYQASSEYIRWAYEPALYLWPDVETDSDSSYYGSSDEGIKYQDNTDGREQEEVVSVMRMNSRRLIWGDKYH